MRRSSMTTRRRGRVRRAVTRATARRSVPCGRRPDPGWCRPSRRLLDERRQTRKPVRTDPRGAGRRRDDEMEAEEADPPVRQAGVRMGTPQGRWVLLTTVLGSGLAMLDATVVNFALRRIGTDLGARFAGVQWTVNAYTLTLASLILLGGSLSDRFGRRRIFVVGVWWFAAASLLCGLAPNIETLVAARALQGVGGALLTPGSLAIISASFAAEDRAAAVGAWRSEEHTSELQSRQYLVCRLVLEKK